MSYTKMILKKENASDVVFDYKAREFPLVIGPAANDFVSAPVFQSSDFQINPLAAEQSGVAKLRREALNDKIEEEALLQLKSVQENAYKEAYELGLTEGRDQAFQAQKVVLDQKLSEFDQLLRQFHELKSQLAADHEAHIIELIYHIASRIAMRDIQKDPTSILPVVTKVITDAQSEEQLTVHLSASDFAFLEEVRAKTGRVAEDLRRVRLEVQENVSPGGCLLHSNYGSIDATVEMRVKRAWDALAERLPDAQQRSDQGEGHGT